MKKLNEETPVYLRDLSRDERSLIVHLRMCSAEQKEEISKHLKESANKPNN